MTNEEEKFLKAALAENGQPISAGGPPLRILGSQPAPSESEAKFIAAAKLEDGQPISAGHALESW